MGPVNREPESIISSEFVALFALLFALANFETANNGPEDMVPHRRKKVRHFGFRWKSFQTIIKSDGNKSDEIDSIINYYINVIDY